MIPRLRAQRRVAVRLSAVLAVVAVLALATLAMPVTEWRTGRLPVEPLALTEGGPPVAVSSRVWIDTDAACGHGRTTDPDDCLALLMLLRSPDVEVVGISTVHGNAPLEVTDGTTRELVARVAGAGGDAPFVHAGSAHALEEGRATAPAHEALARALAEGPLTVVALGPLTNVAAALAGRPALRANVSRVVAVMGRRMGHIFHPSEGEGRDAMLFGHGPVFRDFNFVQDPLAAREVLAMGLPLTLAPYEAARQVTLTAADIDAIASADAAADWVAEGTRGWLDYWREDVGIDGFYPFDAMAAAWVLRPGLLDCAHVSAWVGEDPRIAWSPAGPHHLLVGPGGELAGEALARGRALYCPRVRPAMHGTLVSLLTGRGGVER